MKKIYINKTIIYMEYFFVFVFLCLAYFFMIPQSDVFLFSRDTQANIFSVFNSAMHYGNGRLLGNIVGMGFSHLFDYAFLLVASGITLLIIFVNKYVFGNNKYTIVAVAILIAFPSSNMMSETYYLFASFTNYVLPCLIIVFSALLLKYFDNLESENLFLNCIYFFMLAVTGIASCFFSENTTVVVVTFSVLSFISGFLKNKKLKMSNLVYLLATSVGSFIMIAIPKITKTSSNMDHYRAFEISVGRITSNFVKFSEVICNLTLVMACVSAALIYLCIKKTKVNHNFKVIQVSFFLLFTLISMVVSDFETRDVYISRANFISAFAVGLYLIFAVWIVFSVTDKKLRWNFIFYGILLASSIGPMMFVTQYGYRTYYTTFVILNIFALNVFKLAFNEIRFELKFCNFKIVKKSFVLCCIAIFSLLNLFMFIQSVYNFDFYVIRTQMIEKQLECIEQTGKKIYIEAYTLPCEGISIEDEYADLIFDIVPNGRYMKTKTIGIFDCDAKEDIMRIIESNFVSNLFFATENLEYKEPLILVK